MDWTQCLDEADLQEMEEDAVDVEEFVELELDITDLMIHLLQAYKRDEVHILDDPKTGSILIIVPSMETSE